MAQLTVSRLRSMSEADVRAAFERFMKAEQASGLQDIKFAVSADEQASVVEAMREILLIEAAADIGHSRPFVDF